MVRYSIQCSKCQGVEFDIHYFTAQGGLICRCRKEGCGQHYLVPPSTQQFRYPLQIVGLKIEKQEPAITVVSDSELAHENEDLRRQVKELRELLEQYKDG